MVDRPGTRPTGYSTDRPPPPPPPPHMDERRLKDVIPSRDRRRDATDRVVPPTDRPSSPRPSSSSRARHFDTRQRSKKKTFPRFFFPNDDRRLFETRVPRVRAARVRDARCATRARARRAREQIVVVVVRDVARVVVPGSESAEIFGWYHGWGLRCVGLRSRARQRRTTSLGMRYDGDTAYLASNVDRG